VPNTLTPLGKRIQEMWRRITRWRRKGREGQERGGGVRLARAVLDKFLIFKFGTGASVARCDIPEDMELGCKGPCLTH